jgi:hypothetical protein
MGSLMILKGKPEMMTAEREKYDQPANSKAMVL